MSKTPIIDISPPVSTASAVWPGDVPFSRDIALALANGDNLTLSSIKTTLHIGAHADAPAHYLASGQCIDAVDLAPYVGPCYVHTCRLPPGALISAADCAPALAQGARRLLFRTLSQPDPVRFNTNFVSLSAAAVAAMGRAGVLLVGIDTASVDPFDSKDLPAHKALATWGIKNLEGLALSHVADGAYELIALPLKLVGCDASPVRAVLRALPA